MDASQLQLRLLDQIAPLQYTLLSIFLINNMTTFDLVMMYVVVVGIFTASAMSHNVREWGQMGDGPSSHRPGRGIRFGHLYLVWFCAGRHLRYRPWRIRG